MIAGNLGDMLLIKFQMPKSMTPRVMLVDKEGYILDEDL